MTKKALVYIFYFFIASKACLSQMICSCSGLNNLKSETYLSGELLTSSSYQPDIVTYFNREWLSGDIFLKDGGKLGNKNIRYNSLLDELFCLEPESNQILKLDKEAIQQFHFYNFQGDTSVYFKKFRIKKNLSVDSADVFVQELYHGNLSLYIIRSFYFDHREVVRVNNSYLLKDIYKLEPVYFLEYSNNRIIEFKVFARKSLLTHFPEKKDQIKKFFRESPSFRVKSESGLIELMKVLDSGD